MCTVGVVIFFVCRHKTAYEVRISDWSSDVCASDLLVVLCGSRPWSSTGVASTSATAGRPPTITVTLTALSLAFTFPSGCVSSSTPGTQELSSRRLPKNNGSDSRESIPAMRRLKYSSLHTLGHFRLSSQQASDT